MIGVILAGGEGVRLRPLTYYFQKCMIPIGSSQKPLLEYIIRLFKYHNIKNIALLIGYKYEQVINYFNDGKRFNVNIKYVIDEPNIKGTANVLLNAYKKKIFNNEDILIIYYGDILSNIDLKDFINFHKKNNAIATIALSKSYKLRVGVADIDKENKIRKFIEKPTFDKPISIGIIALNSKELKNFNINKDISLDIMDHLIPNLIENNKPVYGYITNAFWYDIGSIERYEKLSNKDVDNFMNFLLKE